MASCIAVWPENAGPGPFPASYLSDDHTAWTRRTSLERYVEGLPMIVAMLDGRRGWYTDSSVEPRGAFETFILRDLVGFVDRTFRTRADCGGRVIAGLSMGGCGAVKRAWKFPEVFCAPAERLEPGRRPVLRIDCGTEDSLLGYSGDFTAIRIVWGWRTNTGSL